MTAVSFDILGRDKASPAFDKVSRSAERTEKKFGFLAARSHGLTAGMTAGFGKIAGAMAAVATVSVFKSFIDEARESRKVAALTQSIIKSTGGAAKISAKQVGDLATAISNKTGVDDEAVQSGSNLLLTFKNVRNEVGKGAKIFDRATAAAVDLSAAGFGDIAGASKMLGKALNDPLKGLTALGKAGVTFTADQKKQIETLVKTGDILSAQKIILKEVESQVGGAAAAAADPMEKLGVIIGNVKETIGTAFLPIVDKAATWLGNVLPGAVDKAGQFFSQKLLPPLKVVTGFIQDKVIPLAGKIVTGFTGLGKKLVSAIGSVDLAGIGDKLWSGASKWAGTLIDGWKSGLEKGDWKPLGKAIGEGITSAVQNIGEGTGKLFDAIGNLIDKVDWGKLGDKINTAIQGLLHSIDWGKLGASLGDAVVMLFQKTKDLGQKIGTAFKAVIDKVDWKQIGRDSTNAIGEFISGVDWGRVAKVLGISVLGSLKISKTVHDAVINAASDLVLGMLEVIVNKMSEGREWIVKKTSELGGWLWAGLKSGIVAGAKGIGSWLKSTIVDPVVNSVKSFFGVRSPSTVFAGIGLQLIAGLKGGIAAAARGIGTWIYRAVIVPVVTPFLRAGTWLVQHGRNLVAGFKGGVSAIASGIGRWMYDHIISPAVAPFGKAGTWLNSAGRNVIAGFKNGMVAIWGDVTKWVGGIATWIKDHKGPVSLDGRLLIPAGRAIMSGFLKGLKSGAGPAWNFVQSVGGKTVSALQAAIGGPFMGGGKAPTDVSGVKALVRTLAAQRGWGSGGEWDALYNLIMGESGFNPNAQNPTSTAYGLFQFLNSTWGAVGASKTSDPWGQTAAGLKYIAMSYGDPINAYAKWSSRSPHWYANGGVIAEKVLGVGLRSGRKYGFGEHGAEVVTPMGRVPRAPGGAQTVVLEFRSDGSPHMDYLVREFRKYVRASFGGDVQAALGNG